jgi:hypothetical protein
VIKTDPLSLYFDGHDLERRLLAGGEGWYDFEGWSVAFGQSTSKQQQMLVSVHESLHAILTNCTVWGSLLHIAAHLHAEGLNGSESTSRLLALIEPTRKAQEAYATYGSLLVVGRGVPDGSLLSAYPAYLSYFETAKIALAGLDGGFASNCGLNALFRLCLQPDGPWAGAVAPLSMMELAAGDIAMHPDRRLEALTARLDERIWRRLVGAACERSLESPQWLDLEAHLAGARDYDSVSGHDFDDLENIWLHTFYEGLDQVLVEAGACSLSYDGHQPITHDLVAGLENLHKPNGRRRPLIAAGGAHQERDHVHEFGYERLWIRDAPLPARLVSSAPLDQMTCARIEQPHLFLAVRYPRRLVEQFSFSAGDRDRILAIGEGPLVVLRRPVDADGGRHVDVQLIERPEDLISDLPMVSNLSLACLAQADWQAKWWPTLRRQTRSTVLFDLHPFRTLEHWDKQHGRRLSFHWGDIDVGARRHLAFFCRLDDGVLPLCIALVSGMVGNALQYFVTRQDCWSALPQSDATLVTGDAQTLKICLGHLAMEECFFDFAA